VDVVLRQLCAFKNDNFLTLLFAGCHHAGLPPRKHRRNARQLPGRGRTLGRHGVPRRRRSHRHRHSRQVRGRGGKSRGRIRLTWLLFRPKK